VVRQAHTYLVGAMSGATLIAIAIAAFVVLVSAQVFGNWPIAALGDGGGSSSVSANHAVAGPGGPAGNAAGGAGAVAGAARAARGAGSSGSAARRGKLAVEGPEARQGGSTVGVPGPGGGGEGGGSSPGSTQGGGSSNPGATGSGSGGSGGGGSGGGGSGASSPSTRVTETVNQTVSGVDEGALGGTLEKTGVTGVTEGVVNGALGPESAVGGAVDETVGAVGGLLPGEP